MTALNDSGYGVIYLTPNQQVDFSAGTATIKWSMSTFRKSTRDWVDVWITPFSDNLQLPLQTYWPDLNGPPRRAIHIFMDNFSNTTPFRAEVYDNFVPTAIDGNWWTGYESLLVPSQLVRSVFELDISHNHLKFGMPAYNFWWIDRDIPGLDWSNGVVQFGHHSYNPTKDCPVVGTCLPNTWHWDDVSISPALPFIIDRAIQRYVNDSVSSTDFASPAPANAFLRFSGTDQQLEVSFDDGVSWQTAQIQNQVERLADHFQSYWMPIPVGTSRVTFRSACCLDWQARDISIWAQTAPLDSPPPNAVA